MEEGFKKFFHFMDKAKWVILGVWLAIIIGLGYCGIRFLDSTSSVFQPPAGSDSDIAQKVYSRFFPDKKTKGVSMFFIATTDVNSSATIEDDYWGPLTTAKIYQKVKSWPTDPNFTELMIGRYLFNATHFTADPLLDNFTRKAFLSPDKKSAIILAVTKETATSKTTQFVDDMREFLESSEIDKKDGKYMAEIIGQDAMVRDMATSAIADLGRTDAISLPIAFVILLIAIRSLTLILVPLASLAGSIAFSFGIMYPIALSYDVLSFSSAIMMSISIAMSIDYSLFNLSRFTEELRKGKKPYDACMTMLRYSGLTIVVSGSILSLCCLSLVIFPVESVRLVGVGAMFSVIGTVLAALTIMPSLILAFPNFFSIKGVIPCIESCRNDVDPPPRTLHIRDTKSIWFKFTKMITGPTNNFVAFFLMIAATIPFTLGMLKYYNNIGIKQILPTGSRVTEAMTRFSQEWPPGELQNIVIHCVPDYYVKDGVDKEVAINPVYNILNEDFFDVCHSLVDTLTESGIIKKESFLSICSMGGKDVQINEAQYLLQKGELAYSTVFGLLSDTKTMRATQIQVNTNVDPTHEAKKVINVIRPILENYTKNSLYSFYLTSPLANLVDAADKSLDFFPYIVIALVVIIFIIIFALFGSPVLPIRMIIMIGISVLWTFGVGSGFFCTDWFSGAWKEIGDMPGLSWLNIMVICLLIGLALDYDIFLYTRVHEFRMLGFSPRASIILGSRKTGAIISWAGGIMAVAFFGLVFSSLLLVGQVALMLCVGVLYDTFAARFINQSVMDLLGDLNFTFFHLPAIKYPDAKEYYPDVYEAQDVDDEEDLGDVALEEDRFEVCDQKQDSENKKEDKKEQKKEEPKPSKKTEEPKKEDKKEQKKEEPKPSKKSEESEESESEESSKKSESSEESEESESESSKKSDSSSDDSDDSDESD